MKKSTFKSIFAASTVLLTLASCISSGLRSPSGDKSPEDLIFNAGFENSSAKPNYEFELIDLGKLSAQRIEFHEVHLRDKKANEKVRNWIEDLRQFTLRADKKTEFMNKEVLITVKKSSLETLVKALDFLSAKVSDQGQLLREQAEIISAFNNTFKPPLENGISLEIATMVFQFLDRMSDIKINNPEPAPVINIKNSSYWTDRRNSGVDMALGAGSSKMLNVIKQFQNLYDQNGLSIVDQTCEYQDAKRGYGVHLGFKIKCFDKNFKLKLGEARGGPLDSKIYYRLGYNVPGIFYLKNINVKYDRRILTEADVRKSQYIKLKLLGIKLAKVKIPKQSDMQNRIDFAVLNDGSKLSGPELMKNLIPNCPDSKCHMDDSLYNAEYEKNIAYVNFNDVAVMEDTGDFEFGSWAYDDLDHKKRTEVNAIAFLGAITGNIDLRKDNNRLIWNKRTGEVQHTLSDPGRGLGKGSIFSSQENLNKFPWVLLDEYEVRDQGGNSDEVRKVISIKGYKPFMKHKSFSQIDISEARWMARQFASISEDDLTEAFITSGFSMAEVLLLREKFVSKQKNMIEVLKIGNEFPQLMSRQINKNLNYQLSGRPAVVTLGNGRTYNVEEQGRTLVNGVLGGPPAPTVVEPNLDHDIDEIHEVEF